MLRTPVVVAAIAYAACTSRERVTGPESRALTPSETAAALQQPGCGASCVLAATSAPLWSALAMADSAAIPVELASVTLAGAPGDSVMLSLTADAALLAALPADEMLTVVTPGAATSVPLGGLRTAGVFYRFSASDTVLVRYQLNRRLATVLEGAFVLTQQTGARVVAAWSPR